MAEKHTPGPWRIFRDGASNDTAYVRTEAEFAAGEIAVLYTQPNEAYARLIASAPELLEALEAVVSVKLARECKHDEEYDYCDCCKHDWEKEVEAARKLAEAAICKAKGK